MGGGGTLLTAHPGGWGCLLCPPSLSPQSIYPPTLSRGLPRSHHIVTYLLLLSTESHQQLEVSTSPVRVRVRDKPRGLSPGVAVGG